MTYGLFLTRERRAELPDICVRAWTRVGRWFVVQDKGSAVPYHGFGRFSSKFGRFWSRKGLLSAQGMVPEKALFEGFSQRDFSSYVGGNCRSK
jgi:hypothetical protein